MWWVAIGFHIGIVLSIIFIISLFFRKSRIILRESIFAKTYYGYALELFTKNYSYDRPDEYEAKESILAFVFGTLGIVLVIIILFMMLSILGLLIGLLVGISIYLGDKLYKQYSKD